MAKVIARHKRGHRGGVGYGIGKSRFHKRSSKRG